MDDSTDSSLCSAPARGATRALASGESQCGPQAVERLRPRVAVLPCSLTSAIIGPVRGDWLTAILEGYDPVSLGPEARVGDLRREGAEARVDQRHHSKRLYLQKRRQG